MGMSHPHDGYDSATARTTARPTSSTSPGAGDETNSMMSYIDLNWDFSQFDRDNHWRTTAASYLTSANAIAELVLDSDDPARASRHWWTPT